MTIITEGDLHFRYTCSICGCVFERDYTEVEIKNFQELILNCPTCKNHGCYPARASQFTSMPA